MVSVNVSADIVVRKGGLLVFTGSHLAGVETYETLLDHALSEIEAGTLPHTDALTAAEHLEAMALRIREAVAHANKPLKDE